MKKGTLQRQSESRRIKTKKEFTHCIGKGVEMNWKVIWMVKGGQDTPSTEVVSGS